MLKNGGDGGGGDGVVAVIRNENNDGFGAGMGGGGAVEMRLWGRMVEVLAQIIRGGDAGGSGAGVHGREEVMVI